MGVSIAIKLMCVQLKTCSLNFIKCIIVICFRFVKEIKLCFILFLFLASLIWEKNKFTVGTGSFETLVELILKSCLKPSSQLQFYCLEFHVFNQMVYLLNGRWNKKKNILEVWSKRQSKDIETFPKQSSEPMSFVPVHTIKT